MSKIACPLIYATGKACAGHIARIEAFKAELWWVQAEDGRWSFEFSPRSHYHLFCSLKNNHAGDLRPDHPQMKFHYRELPEELRALISATDVVPMVGERPISGR